MKTKETLLQDSYRADSYKLLSECYHLPDAQLLQRLKAVDESIGKACLELIQYTPNFNEIESLSVDFSRLFIGPFKLLAPPYGSVYLDNSGKLMGDSTVDVKDIYRQDGLNVSIKDMPDHITIELEFMYFLIFKGIETVNISDFEKHSYFLQRQRFFLDTHLARWITDFTKNIAQNAQTEFYRNLGRITEQFVKDDLKYLRDISSVSGC